MEVEDRKFNKIDAQRCATYGKIHFLMYFLMQRFHQVFFNETIFISFHVWFLYFDFSTIQKCWYILCGRKYSSWIKFLLFLLRKLVSVVPENYWRYTTKMSVEQRVLCNIFYLDSETSRTKLFSVFQPTISWFVKK